MNNEPVAWMGIRRHGETRVNVEKLANDDIPLYTHPVKELTDEEIDGIAEEYFKVMRYGLLADVKGFAKAILRKAKE